jgi:dTDP-4-amino-4,6-dideoxygalactose transaminase
MDDGDDIILRRIAMWNHYHKSFGGAERAGWLRRPVAPEHCTRSAHTYDAPLPDQARRTSVIRKLKAAGVPMFHFIALHSAPVGRRYARPHGDMTVTDDIADRLLHLPMFVGLKERQTVTIGIAMSVL